MVRMHSGIVFAVSLFLVVGLGWGQQLTIFWPDIEQGACMLVVGPEEGGVRKALLIDSGTFHSVAPEEQPAITIGRFLEENPMVAIKYVVISHDDRDHYSWIASIRTAGLLAADVIEYRWDTEDLPGTSIELGGGAKALVVVANGKVWTGKEIAHAATPGDDNARSVGILISYLHFQAWVGGGLGGDLPGSSYTDLETPIASYIGDVDLYVMHHHGSKYSSSRVLLDVLKPEVSICQAGDGNNYGHPTAEAVARVLATVDTDSDNTNGTPLVILQNRGSYTLTTPGVYIADPDGPGGLPGTITLTTDGYSYTIEAAGLPETLRLFTDSIAPRATPTQAVRIVRVPTPCTVVLGNFTDKPISIGGWDLRDNTTFFMIPAGTTLPPYGTLLILVTTGCHESAFWVAQRNDYVLLYNADGNRVDQWQGGPMP
ncbi:MAG: lamin tail domain-containing protein [Candidatus Bipolaricaulis anaerobius]